MVFISIEGGDSWTGFYSTYSLAPVWLVLLPNQQMICAEKRIEMFWALFCRLWVSYNFCFIAQHTEHWIRILNKTRATNKWFAEFIVLTKTLLDRCQRLMTAQRQVKLHHIPKMAYRWLQQVYMFAMLSRPNEQSIALTGASQPACNSLHHSYSLPSVGYTSGCHQRPCSSITQGHFDTVQLMWPCGGPMSHQTWSL